jgi:uncharacterized UBP type Zn finger protein
MASSDSSEKEGEEDTIVTILCGHTFHWDCLINYQEPLCPLCRFSMCPVDSNTCEECDQTENLLVCLVCGSIGCFKALSTDLAGGIREVKNMGHSRGHYE